MNKPLSNQTKHWQALDARHHMHPFTTHHELAASGARVITRAEGVYLYDSEGNRILDGMAGLWCVQVGYGREELADAGYKALKELPYYNAFFQTTHPYVAELGAKLAELTPEGIDRFFYANSGSEGNDSAVKLIRYFWNLQGKPSKKIFIARNKAYHGVTMAATSLSGITAMHPQADLPLPGFTHIATPYWYGDGGDEDGDFLSWAKKATERAVEEIPDTEGVQLTGTPLVLVNGSVYVGALDDPKEFAQFVLTIDSDAYYQTSSPTPTPTP